MAKHPNRNWGIFAIFAALAGFLAGILTAPKSGKETREDIKNTANRVVSEAEKKLKEMHSEMNVVIMQAKSALEKKSGKAKVELDKALTIARDKQVKVRDMLSALRDGGSSEDPELSKAIKEAKSALVHLKKYLK